MAEQPKHSEFEQQILTEVDKFVTRIRNGRQEWLRNCYENILYYLGHHWIDFDKATNRFRRLNLRRDTPRPVTNKYKAVIDELIAVIARVEPSLTFAPGSDADNDRVTADLAKIVLKYLEKITEVGALRLQLAPALTMMHNVYLVSGYDFDKGPIERVPNWECPSHPGVTYSADEAQQVGNVCPKDQQPLVQSKTSATEVSPGQCTSELATPFEMWIDTTIKNMQDQPIVIYRSMRSLDWVHSRYPDKKEFVTEDSGTYDVGMHYLQSVIRLVPGANTAGFGGGQRFENSVIVDKVFIPPRADFPKGGYAWIANQNVVLEAKPYPFHDGTPENEGRPFLPIAAFRYDDVPGTHISTGPADHLKSPQRRRNRLQASMELWTARSANGVWAIPEGSDIKTPTGEEGIVIRWNPRASDGHGPERIEGTRLPSAVEAQFQQIDAEMMDIAGIREVLQGEAPGRVDSGLALNILQERAQGRFAALFLGLEKSHRDWARHVFWIFRNYAPDEVYYQIKGGQARWSVSKIKTADLQGGIDIDVEAGSAAPKSMLQKRAAYEQAIQLGMVDVSDPAERIKYLRALGTPELLHEFDVDEEQIMREHDEVVAWSRTMFDQDGNLQADPREGGTLPVQVDPILDNHQLHFKEHREWMLSEEFQALPPSVQKAFREGHFMQHVQILAGAAMMGGAPAAPGAPPGQQQPGPPPSAQGANETATQNGRGYAGREQNKAQQQMAA